MSSTLPKMLIGYELINALQVKPDYRHAIMNEEMDVRLMALQDIYRVFLPSEMSCEIYSKIYLALMRSIQKKKSLLAVRQVGENSKMIRKQSYESIIGGADTFTIIGASGIGKSAAVSRAIHIITDDIYFDINDCKVIPILQVQTPADCSIKGLMLEILRKVDEPLETNYYISAIKSRATTDMLIGTVSQVALNHIGLLVVDEIQNVVNSKNGKTLVGTLTQLINNSGVSLVMVGTPECKVFFEQAYMLARRSLGLCFEPLIYDDVFRKYCDELLSYRYVSFNVEVDEQMYLWLYNHCNGNLSVLVSLIHDAQEIAILTGINEFGYQSLMMAYEQRMSMLHDFIEAEKPKHRPLKQSKVRITGEQKEINENDIKDDKIEFPTGVGILDIVNDAKHKQIDVVEELRKYIHIKEVAV